MCLLVLIAENSASANCQWSQTYCTEKLKKCLFRVSIPVSGDYFNVTYENKLYFTSLSTDQTAHLYELEQSHHKKYLTHYNPVLLFYTPWKHQKTLRFSNVGVLMFSDGIKKQKRAVMG